MRYVLYILSFQILEHPALTQARTHQSESGKKADNVSLSPYTSFAFVCLNASYGSAYEIPQHQPP